MMSTRIKVTCGMAAVALASALVGCGAPTEEPKSKLFWKRRVHGSATVLDCAWGSACLPMV